ncbi:hypothetical protein KW842_02970 [Duganella sp. sic0402]|uniref:hypothetical protein n=1 Tax=Duganella sp. sic0402 TaxID=2854786 RepID=UPI001C491BB5|nr:hypothetical protein [Duganella sp. sic0402]MBV7534720.1 hypothetical protein [Duganella sp. sic0402]
MSAAPRPTRLQFAAPVASGPALQKMFSVAITHDYYAASQDCCPDFVVEPTPDSRRLMSELGMVFRAEQYGFSMYIQSDRLTQLANYLLTPAADEVVSTFWQKLSFCLRLKNSAFINFTRLPIGTCLADRNLYLCNRDAHVQDEAALLCPGEFVTGAALCPVVGRDLTLSGPAGAHVEVRDLSHAVVYPVQDQDPVIFDAAGYAWLNMSSLPFGRYTIDTIDEAGAVLQTRTVLYVAQHIDALLLLDILLTRPTGHSPGVYPVQTPLPKQPAVLTQPAYRLPFTARNTYWQYLVVSQEPGGQLQRLRITGAGTHFTASAAPVILPSGASAIALCADSPLPLRQRSDYAFSLTGRRQDGAGHENPLRISRLPVAASDPVWAIPQFPDQGISEIYIYV